VQKKKEVYIHIFVTYACKISIIGTKKLCKCEKCQTTSHGTICKNCASGNLTNCKPKKAKWTALRYKAVHKQVPSAGHYKLTVYNHADTGTVAGHWQTLLLQPCIHTGTIARHYRTLLSTIMHTQILQPDTSEHSWVQSCTHRCCSQTLANTPEYNPHTGAAARH
jgi:hypothetical protein